MALLNRKAMSTSNYTILPLLGVLLKIILAELEDFVAG